MIDPVGTLKFSAEKEAQYQQLVRDAMLSIGALSGFLLAEQVTLLSPESGVAAAELTAEGGLFSEVFRRWQASEQALRLIASQSDMSKP